MGVLNIIKSVGGGISSFSKKIGSVIKKSADKIREKTKNIFDKIKTKKETKTETKLDDFFSENKDDVNNVIDDFFNRFSDEKQEKLKEEYNNYLADSSYLNMLYNETGLDEFYYNETKIKWNLVEEKINDILNQKEENHQELIQDIGNSLFDEIKISDYKKGVD